MSATDGRRRAAPGRPLEHGSDVPGRVALSRGGSASNDRPVARPARRTLRIDRRGRARCGRPGARQTPQEDGVTPYVRRVAGARTGRIGVLVAPDGERSFVAGSRRGGLLLGRPTWGVLVRPRRCAPPAGLFVARRATRARRPPADRARVARRARSVSVDLASIGRCSPRAGGRPARWSSRSRRTSCSRPPPRPRHCSGATRSRDSSGWRRSRW